MKKLTASLLVLFLAFPAEGQTLLHTFFAPTGPSVVQVPFGLPIPPISISAGFGRQVLGISDTDGDAVPDIVVSSPFEEVNGQLQAGAVRVLSGATGALLLTLVGTPSTGECFGMDIGAAGDVNGDGIPDIIVSRSSLGYVSLPALLRIYSGANGQLLRTLSVAVPQIERLPVVGVGDTDGDSVPDVLVGCPGSSRAMLVSGATGAVRFMWTGTGYFDRFGRGVAVLGDVDGDTIADLAILAERLLGSAPGYVRVLSGATGALLYSVGNLDTTSKASLAAVGDTDGDGIADLAVGMPQLGQVMVFSGGDGSLVRVQSGASADSYGAALSALDDIDADGFADFAIGAHQSPIFDWGTWTYSPGGVGFVEVVSGGSGTVIGSVQGITLLDEMGRALASVGDLDGDGQRELIASAPQNPLNSYVGSGYVEVVSFAAPPPGAGSTGQLYAGALAYEITINGSGGGVARSVAVSTGQPFTIEVQDLPGAPAPSSFAVWGLLDYPGPPVTTPIGPLYVVPQVLDPANPMLFTLTNNAWTDPLALLPSTPTPWSLAVPGIPFAFKATLQGLMVGPGPSATLSLSNPIILDVVW